MLSCDFFIAVKGIHWPWKTPNLQKIYVVDWNFTETNTRRNQLSTTFKLGGGTYYELRNIYICFILEKVSHYRLKENKEKWYLPEELTVKIMFQINYPTSKILWGFYYGIFKRQFNISFGYLRSDTDSI